jgi:hypothetical protein
VDSIAESEWNSLVVSKPKKCIIDATQQFVVEASLLAKKCTKKWTTFKKLGRDPYNLYLSWTIRLKKIKKKQSKPEMEAIRN